MKEGKMEAFLLGILGPEIPKDQKRLFMYPTTDARMLLAQRWKEDNLPTKEEWLIEMMDYAELAKMTGKIGDQEDNEFNKEWEIF